jgi:hypothetical protein
MYGALAHPSNFYVNLHNGMFPAGAIRGQISDPYRVVVEPVPLPAAAWLFGSGLLGLVGIARNLANIRSINAPCTVHTFHYRRKIM